MITARNLQLRCDDREAIFRFLLPDGRVGSVGLGSEGAAGGVRFVAGSQSLIELKKNENAKNKIKNGSTFCCILLQCTRSPGGGYLGKWKIRLSAAFQGKSC